jgi:FixJ family two-component response regulator
MATRRNTDGDLEGYVVAFDDVTDLVSAQRMAAWGDVARRIAHEIKNPLTPIQLSAERISRKFGKQLSEEDAASLSQMTEVVVRQTNDLRRIVDEFSKFARMPEPETRAEDAVQLVREAVTLQQAGQPGTAFTVSLPDEPIMAELDATMIGQALTNLMKNGGEAIESLREKGVPEAISPELRVRMQALPEALVIEIADNGIGLPPDRAKLFEPYVTTREKGTGLGLPIVKKIIEEHGGTLELVDAEEFSEGAHRGAMARITLPRLARRTRESLSMSDILVVDDERDIRELICDILEDEGFTTRRAGTSDECMAELNKAAPGLMILDIWLKDSSMDGIDILKHVKLDNPDVPVVIISGHGNIEIAVAAIKQGAYDFIEKPFNIDQLMVVIRRAMETSRLRRENAQLRRQEVRGTDMIGSSAGIKLLKSQLEKVTKSNGRVMLTGGAGSGKEVAARWIHANSNRSGAPFVTVSTPPRSSPTTWRRSCSAAKRPERGVEQGLLEQAHGGIIYFDEVADMPLGTQSKILRVLVDQSFTRVGGTAKVRVDLRVISSTDAGPAAGDRRGRSGRNSITGSTWCRSRCPAGGPARGHSRACPAFHRAVQRRTGPACGSWARTRSRCCRRCPGRAMCASSGT